ncbi:MAG: 4-hydroxy-3-methylbut-2-enyl diphosphate reductase [Melioribacteraceae bacterium]
MRKFEIPTHYRSNYVQKIKDFRKENDHYKKDFSPTELDFGTVKVYLARHFGFCFGVENAIEIAYKIIEEHPDKNIYLLSEMIHNPGVNQDLLDRGVKFIMDKSGNYIVAWDKISSEDIVMIPAFGTTLETENLLTQKGIDIYKYNTTCPFVEKVWTRSSSLGLDNYTVVIHGKVKHEETKATFSHAKENTPAVIVRDIEETNTLVKILHGEIPKKKFYSLFKGKYSEGFDVTKDLIKIGVVNQTTMLASETQEISDKLKEVMGSVYGKVNIDEHFADTRDTLCYATNDNQQATVELLKTDADLAFVVGGYNSSNTSHIVELLERKFPTYFISDESKIISKEEISHFDISTKIEKNTKSYLPKKDNVKIVITSGASCPDVVVEKVFLKIYSYFPKAKEINEVLVEFLQNKKKT